MSLKVATPMAVGATFFLMSLACLGSSNRPENAIDSLPVKVIGDYHRGTRIEPEKITISGNRIEAFNQCKGEVNFDWVVDEGNNTWTIGFESPATLTGSPNTITGGEIKKTERGVNIHFKSSGELDCHRKALTGDFGDPPGKETPKSLRSSAPKPSHLQARKKSSATHSSRSAESK